MALRPDKLVHTQIMNMLRGGRAVCTSQAGHCAASKARLEGRRASHAHVRFRNLCLALWLYVIDIRVNTRLLKSHLGDNRFSSWSCAISLATDYSNPKPETQNPLHSNPLISCDATNMRSCAPNLDCITLGHILFGSATSKGTENALYGAMCCNYA